MSDDPYKAPEHTFDQPSASAPRTRWWLILPLLSVVSLLWVYGAFWTPTQPFVTPAPAPAAAPPIANPATESPEAEAPAESDTGS